MPSKVCKLNPVEAAYIAAFWDSEGTIGIWKATRKDRPRSIYFRVGMTAGNTNLELLESVRHDIGAGTIYTENRKNPKHKTLYRLVISQGFARDVLPQLIPYLRAKRMQAELALQMLGTKTRNDGRRGITDEVWENQAALYKECAPLNQRGIQ
ncbi:MAG: LAGLIDADG family homing endonuclease [Pyrinomonadaceae bacterium]